MFKSKKWMVRAVFGALVLGALAYGAQAELMDHQRDLPQAFHQGVYVTTYPDDGTTTRANKVTSMLSASATIDFPFVPDAGTLGCNDSAPISVPGANVNDPCIASYPSDGGTYNGTVTCYVSFADFVRVRFCSQTYVVDPPSATYKVRVIGN